MRRTYDESRVALMAVIIAFPITVAFVGWMGG